MSKSTHHTQPEVRVSSLDAFEQVQEVSQLKARQRAWEAALLEVMYSEWATEETVLESSREVFGKFQPMLAHAYDAAKAAAEEEGGKQNCNNS